MKISTQKQKEWSAKILKFKKSGKTPEEWCNEYNISMRQFSYWFRQFGQEAGISDNSLSTKWLPIEIKQNNSVPQFLNVKIGGAIIEVNPGFDKEHLLDVLKILKGL